MKNLNNPVNFFAVQSDKIVEDIVTSKLKSKKKRKPKEKPKTASKQPVQSVRVNPARAIDCAFSYNQR